MTLDRAVVAAMLTSAATLLADNADRLSEIDSRFGDGDHGVTIKKIARLLLDRVPQWEDESIQEFLDDLGTEMQTAFTTSAFYNLLSGRLMKQRPMIVNTNLMPVELSKRYSGAIASRLLGEFRQFRFIGEDIRMLRRKSGK